MAQFNPIDHNKIQYKYLGWGVDCRKDEEEWRESLKCYDGNQIRDIGNNINEIPHSEEFLVKETYKESKGGHGGGSVGAEVPFAGLNAKIKIGFMAINASNSITCTKCVTKKTITLQEDVCRDPYVTTMTTDNGSEVYYSNFELLLSKHILQYIDDKQRKSKLPAGADLGESVQTLQGENAIEKLQKLTKRNKPQLWQLVADACANFIDKIGCTHYVYSITLGKRVIEEMQRIKQETIINAGAEAKAPVKGAVVGVDIGSGRQDSTDSTYRRVEEIGDDNKLEVIQAELKPLSSLISEMSHNLKEVLENLLESYSEIMEGESSYLSETQTRRGKKKSHLHCLKLL